MGIDRKAFYALAMGIWAGPSVGCIIKEPPQNTTPQTNDNRGTGGPSNTDTNANMNATGECVQWDNAGNCTTYQPVAENAGGMGGGTCLQYNATGECSSWGPSYEAGYAPAQECVS